MESIKATVEIILFPKKGQFSDFKIVRTDRGVVKGNIMWEPEIGQRLQFKGMWIKSPYNGEKEFKFFFASLDVPDNPRSLLSYVASITHGIGEVKEQEIWNTYGEEWADDQGLSLVDGISDKTRESWELALIRIENEKEKTSAISFLLANGSTPRIAELSWQRWGTNTVPIVTNNCYDISSLHGVGFITVDDKIRQHFGITDNDTRRYQAAILYILQDSGRGDTMIAKTLLVTDMQELGLFEIDEHLGELIIDSKVVELVDGDTYLCLDSDYKNEGAIFRRFHAI